MMLKIFANDCHCEDCSFYGCKSVREKHKYGDNLNLINVPALPKNKRGTNYICFR